MKEAQTGKPAKCPDFNVKFLKFSEGNVPILGHRPSLDSPPQCKYVDNQQQ